MSEEVYTINKIQEMIMYVLKKYGIEKAYIFGSYARNEANKDSDVDIMIAGGKKINTLLDLVELEMDLKNILKKNVDVIREEVYVEHDDDEDGELARKIFMNNVMKERINIL